MPKISNITLKRTWKYTKMQFSYLILSIIGLAFLAFITYSSNISGLRMSNQSLITSGIFVIICLLGIVAGLSPQFLSQSNKTNEISFRGHHPICKQFTNHVLQWGERTLCAGCSGLITGACLAIVYSILYIRSGNFFGIPLTVFWSGIFFVGIGLLQHFIYVRNPVLHFLLNVVFVLGSSFILFSLDFLGASIRIIIYLLALILFWIIVRIRLSQFDHVKICLLCDLRCEQGFI